MPIPDCIAPEWSTSAFGTTTQTSNAALSVLEAHIVECRRLGGRSFFWQRRLEAVGGFVAPRLVTLVVALAAIGVVLARWAH